MESLGFTFPEMEGNYTVSYSQDEGGMEVLYDITNIFLDAVIGGNFFPDGFLTEEKFPDLESVSSNFPTEVIDNVQPIVMANIPILVCIVLGLLLAVVSLICGIVFCCCCGAKNQKSNDNGFKKLMLSILLFILLVVTSLGCMWFFLGAKTSQEGLDKIPEEITNILHDGDLYMNNTVDELHYLLQENFDEVIDEFKAALSEIGNDFGNFTEDMKININLDEIIDKVNSFLSLIEKFSDTEEEMNNAIASLNNMRDSMKSLTTAGNTHFQCSGDSIPPPNTPICGILNGASNIFDKFPDDFEDGLPELPNTAKDQLSGLNLTLGTIDTQIDTIFAEVIEEFFPSIEAEVENIKKLLAEALDGFSEPIEDIQKQIFRNNEIKNTLEDIRDKYFPYFSMSLFVLGSLLVGILAVFMIGMCFGSCSKNGSRIASTCSGIMFFANAIFFLLAIFLFILCTAFFAVGALGEKALCKTMENPGDSEIVTFVNPLLSSEMTNIYNSIADGDFKVDFDLAKIISDIHSNTAIYPLLQLHFIFDIENLTDWRETYKIDPLIEDARTQINTFMEELLTIKDNLNEENITFAAGEIDKIELAPVVDLDIQEVGGEIERLRTTMETVLGVAQVPEDVKIKMLGYIDDIQEEFESDSGLESSVGNVQQSLGDILQQYGNGSHFQMEETVNSTFVLIHVAFDYFEGPAVMSFFNTSVDTLTKVVDDYVAHAIDAANNHIGNTGPLSNIYNATYTDICIEIVAPFNSVWSGLGWCLLMILIPVTLLVTSVRKIFSASQPGPSMRPQDTNGFKNTKNPAARAVSYEEVPMPAYNERSNRINAYESRASSYQNNHQPSAPPPYSMNGRYQSSTKR